MKQKNGNKTNKPTQILSYQQIKRRTVFNIQTKPETGDKIEAKLLRSKWSEWKLKRMRKQALESEAKLLELRKLSFCFLGQYLLFSHCLWRSTSYVDNGAGFSRRRRIVPNNIIYRFKQIVLSEIETASLVKKPSRAHRHYCNRYGSRR